MKGRLPVYVMYDSGLDDFEQSSVVEAMSELKALFPERMILVFGSKAWSKGDYSSADWYIKNAKKANDSQLEATTLVDLMMREPWQRKDPHIDVLFTSYDLTVQGLNFCFGLTMGRYTVQSVYRYRCLNFKDRKLAIKSVVWHELGHVLGAAMNTSRKNTEYKLGPHCTNHGCVMRQGVTLNEWVRNARDTERSGGIYCPQCMRDIHNTDL